MRWIFRKAERVGGRAARFRRTHSAFLTIALSKERSGRGAFPRIPVRPVSAGGFAELLGRPGGRALADRWWAWTFRRMERAETGRRSRGKDRE